MELTRESPRARWLIMSAAWAFLAVLIVAHTVTIQDYVALLDGLGRRGAVAVDTPLQRTIPTVYADAQTWIRHALTLLETDAWRIRFTDIDNAPFGRSVHWNSAFAWMIAVEGWLRHLITGEPIALAVERAVAWSNAPLLFGLILIVSTWTARRAGAGAGVLVALAIVGNSGFYSGFAPNFSDHHGILSVSNLGIILGVVFMGAGWWRGAVNPGLRVLPATREAARGAALFSALAGAIGMWVSAASVIPAIGVAGVAGLLATWWQGRALRSEGAVFDAGLWRLWGRVGAATACLFYLLEYAPAHLELRMEVNHPLYALAWWGGAELVAILSEWHLEGARRRPSVARLAGALAAIAAPVAVIMIGGAKVFVIRDPMTLEISARVSEGLSLPRALRLMGLPVLTQHLHWVAAALLPAGFLILRGPRAERMMLAFGILACLAFLAQCVFQVRFFANVGAPEISLILMALVVLTASWAQRGRWSLILLVSIALCVPERVQRIIEARHGVKAREVSRIDVLQPLYRDIAAALRASQPTGDIVLLTNPDASTAIGYYGRLKTIGTLYWENLPGTKAAAAMYSSVSGPEARALMQARGVTHVAVISESSFVQEYYEMTHPGAKPGEWQQCLAFQLFRKENIPAWLDEVAYEPPADTQISELRVVLFKTRFGPPEAEAAFKIAGTQATTGDLVAATRSIEQALVRDATVAEYWVLKSELLLAQGAIEPALAAAEQSLVCAPAHRAELAGSLANAFYKRPAQAAAAQLYRASLEARYDPTMASNLGWLLATSPDSTLRDGRTALALGERVAAENPTSYVYVSTLAAALAENGRFAEAVEAATRALELARKGNEPNLIARAEARVRNYQSGQPWRQ